MNRKKLNSIDRGMRVAAFLCAGVGAVGCDGGPDGLAASKPAAVTVRVDFFAKPLPEIPLPNDLATRFDHDAATLRRINASVIAPTAFERRTREKIDQLDGWGVFTPITIPFSGDIDPQSVIAAHWGDDYAFANDVVYVVNVTPGSAAFGKPVALDLGNGNYPVVLENRDDFWEHDARGDTMSALFEETDEDANGNGTLDPGEDTDRDGVLDKPNRLPGKAPADDDLVGRANALMTFWERETKTLILRPLRPLRERETYAVLVTRRLKDAKGAAVGSPFRFVHHGAQTDALRPLVDLFAKKPVEFGGLTFEDVAFAWTFTTGSVHADLRAVRSGLYGHGAQAHLAKEFPPDLAKAHTAWDGPKDDAGKQRPNLFIVSGEQMIDIVRLISAANLGLSIDESTDYGKRFYESLRYVDYHVFASYWTPMLFLRKDSRGQVQGYNDMSWPPDLDRRPARAEKELVTFWLAVPKKEVSKRKDGKPADVVVLGHGYTGHKLVTMQFAGYFARHGMATIAIDNVSHGVDLLGPQELEVAKPVFEALHLPGIIDGLLANRSWDQDLDGKDDSGGDFWTAYTFHTRDVVRQTAVDYVQLVRVLRGFDGQRAWNVDSNGDGKIDAKDLAGDFDGDGQVDLGGKDAVLGMTGSSLGGMMSAAVAGIEPQMAATVPMCAGGGLSDVGIRSVQGGVREAVMLRLMGPLYIGYPEADGKSVTIKAVVPRLNDTARIPVASMAPRKPGDSVLAENLDNGEVDCAIVRPGGAFRVGLASDVARDRPQRHRLTFYDGDAFQNGRDPATGKACKLKAGTRADVTIDKFGVDVRFHFQSAPLDFKKGQPLAPIAEGLGMHRARPELRRFIGFAQLVLDPADPAVVMRHALSGEMKYPTGETVNTHSIVLSTIGDMNVPVSTGAALARAAGLLDYTTKVPEWGNRTANQVLIDAKVLEAVDRIPHFYHDQPDGGGGTKKVGTLFDVDDLSGSFALAKDPTAMPYPRGHDGYFAPRLNPPLWTKTVKDDGKGGVSGAFFPYVRDTGKHDIDFPGEQADRLKKLCKGVLDPQTQVVCDQAVKEGAFDHGALVLEAIAIYLKSGGKTWKLDACQNTWTCPDVPKAPALRQNLGW
ncbi:MAG: hypothetical protein EXR79_17230 [Myxococcales bacterium]|nr:hypothetical protein [Myxococcales bacterium]